MQQPSKHSSIIFSLALAAIILFAGIISYTHPSNWAPEKEKQAAQQNSATQKTSPLSKDEVNALTYSDLSYTIGPKDAKVSVAEYYDFQCPFSKQSELTMNHLVKTFSGKPVRFVFRNAPVIDAHPLAFSAAEASLCAAEQNQFLPMYTTLFKQQDGLSADAITNIAHSLTLDANAYDACMTNGKYQMRIQKDLSDAITLKLEGTPVWFIDGDRYVGSIPYDILERVIRDNLTLP